MEKIRDLVIQGTVASALTIASIVGLAVMVAHKRMDNSYEEALSNELELDDVEL